MSTMNTIVKAAEMGYGAQLCSEPSKRAKARFERAGGVYGAVDAVWPRHMGEVAWYEWTVRGWRLKVAGRADLRLDEVESLAGLARELKLKEDVA